MADPIDLESFRNQSRGPTLKGGGGGGTLDEMETRVKMLEYRADQTEKLLVRMDAKLDVLGRDVSEVKGKLSAMPSTWQMVGLIVAMAVAIFTVVRVALPL